jgi:hypothetical protein
MATYTAAAPPSARAKSAGSAETRLSIVLVSVVMTYVRSVNDHDSDDRKLKKP